MYFERHFQTKDKQKSNEEIRYLSFHSLPTIKIACVTSVSSTQQNEKQQQNIYSLIRTLLENKWTP